MKFDFRVFVKNVILQNKYRRLAEIGVWTGELSRILWSLPSTEYLLMVDPFDAACTGMTEKKTQKELDAIRMKLVREKPLNTEIAAMPSVEAAQLVSGTPFDFVFIDAMHTYGACRADIEAWLPKIRKGGMIAGDDYSTRFSGVIKAVDELLPQHTHVNRVWSCKV